MYFERLDAGEEDFSVFSCLIEALKGRSRRDCFIAQQLMTRPNGLIVHVPFKSSRDGLVRYTDLSGTGVELNTSVLDLLALL